MLRKIDKKILLNTIKCDYYDYSGDVSGDGDRNIYNNLPTNWSTEYID